LFPVLDADLKLFPAGGCTLLVLSAAFRLPVNWFHDAPDNLVPRQVATTMVSALLHKVARQLCPETGHRSACYLPHHLARMVAAAREISFDGIPSRDLPLPGPRPELPAAGGGPQVTSDFRPAVRGSWPAGRLLPAAVAPLSCGPCRWAHAR
jgi:hypothetical protein